MIFIYLLITIILLIICSCFLYVFLKKINFELNGMELIFFSIAITFLTKIDSDLNIFYNNYLQLFFFISACFIYFLILLYYLIRLIKKKEYIPKTLILFYVIVSVINVISNIPIAIMMPIGIVNILMNIFVIIAEIVMVIYMLLLNLITLIIKKKNKVSTKIIDTNTSIKNKKRLFMILSIIIPLIVSFLSIIIHNCLEMKYKEEGKTFVINYLQDKYKDEDFTIVDIKKTEECVFLDCSYVPYTYDLKVDNKYNIPFLIKVNINKKQIITDDFIFSYLSYLTNETFEDYYDVENYLIKNFNSTNHNNALFSDFDCVVTFELIDFDQEKFENDFSSKLPDFTDLYKYLRIKEPKIKINRVFKETELEEFNDYILSIYKTLNDNYILDNNYNIILDFEFTYDNPFSDSKFYKNAGYIRDGGNVYLIYTAPTPTIVNK